jgi:hypothetical protein
MGSINNQMECSMGTIDNQMECSMGTISTQMECSMGMGTIRTSNAVCEPFETR